VSSPLRICLLVAALGLAGCATMGIDWNRQVGEMTFDQAISLLGAPNSSEKTEDGKIIAEWASPYAPAGPAAETDDNFRYHSAAASQTPPKATLNESCLRLTFDTNAVLTHWSKN
jgi:hypothetical protein